MSLGSLEIIMGPMFSGKTTELCRRVRRLECTTHLVLIVNHDSDTRYGDSGQTLTHDKAGCASVPVSKLRELQDKDETITDLIDRQQVHLLDETIEEKIEEKCSNSEKVNIERCSELYNNEDKEYMKRLYNESELIIIKNI